MTDTRCGARNRQGGPCGRPPGWGTDHPGQGRCKLHGGATPTKHGRYSKVQRPRVAELLERLEDDPDPLDLLPELQTIRALAIDYVERYDEWHEALIAWHRNGDEHPKPRQILDLADATRLLERAAKVAELILRQKRDGVITMQSFARVMEQMGSTVARHVQDQAVLEAIEAEWLTIRL